MFGKRLRDPYYVQFNAGLNKGKGTLLFLSGSLLFTHTSPCLF